MVISEKDITETLVLWALLALALIPANMAYRKGRDLSNWWFFSLFLWPVALIAAALVPVLPANLARRVADPVRAKRERTQEIRLMYAMALVPIVLRCAFHR